MFRFYRLHWFIGLVLFSPAAVRCSAAAELLEQPWYKTARALPSGGSASMGKQPAEAIYERFNLRPGVKTLDVSWIGACLKGPQKDRVRGWTISLYRDDNGRPGKAILNRHVPGLAKETEVANIKGFPFYRYGIDPIDLPCVCGQPGCAEPPCATWITVVPEIGDPAAWGWATSGKPNSGALREMDGKPSKLGFGMALTIRSVDAFRGGK
jgi:hypothetical protein